MKSHEIDGFAIYEFKPEQLYSIEPMDPFPKKVIFFAHANGVPALTYKVLFQELSHRLNLWVVAYDMRGMGLTRLSGSLDPKIWAWDTLVQDHLFLFEKLRQRFHPSTQWVFAGHSLGAWISLFSAGHAGVESLFLFDPPILPLRVILNWNLVCLLKKRHLNPNGKKVKKRKTLFPSFQVAYEQLSQSAFLKHWPKEVVQDYLHASFAQKEKGVELRHDPLWEGHLFDSYLTSAASGFLKIPRSVRKKIKPIFFVGEKSTVCNPKSKLWAKLFLPQLDWILIENSGHMFPLEEHKKTISKLVPFVN